MKEWRVLVLLEYEWRAFRLYRKLINGLVKRGMNLSSPVLCFFSKRLDKHNILISRLKRFYENQTGKIIVFYKCDEY